MRRLTCCLTVLALSLSAAAAQAPLKSGPQPGTLLPDSFDAFIINGKIAEGRQHCPVCQNALNPTVLIFTREPAANTEKPLTELLAGLDKLLEKHQKSALGGFAVFLSPDARSSVTEDSPVSETDKLLEEATKRRELFARLKTRAEPLKNVIVAAYPDVGPKEYKISPDAAVTVIFYAKVKVIANWAFAKEKLTDNDVNAILTKVDATLTAERPKTK